MVVRDKGPYKYYIITLGGGGVQNWPKVDDVICARSLSVQVLS